MKSYTLRTSWNRSRAIGGGILLASGLIALGGSARADARAEALLQHVQETLSQTQTLSAEFTTSSVYATRYRDTQEKGTILLERPDHVRIEITRYRKPESADTWKATGNGSTLVADGDKIWSLISHPQSAQYRQSAANAVQVGKTLDSLEPLRGFFSAKASAKSETTYAGKERWEGAEYDVVKVKEERTGGRGQASISDAALYIDSDGLIRRYLLRSEGKGQPVLREVALHNIQRNAPVAKTAFVFTPPSDAVPYERTPSQAVLAAGTIAPDFSVEDRDGKTVHLSDLRGKVVVLKFWATWCWSCKQSLPQTNDIAGRYKDQDVVVLAVDIWDSRKAFQAWFSKRQGQEAIRFVIDPQAQGQDVATRLYHVSATPTQFVIDKEGKVVTAVEGYEGPTEQLETALHAAGVMTSKRSASLQKP